MFGIATSPSRGLDIASLSLFPFYTNSSYAINAASRFLSSEKVSCIAAAADSVKKTHLCKCADDGVLRIGLPATTGSANAIPVGSLLNIMLSYCFGTWCIVRTFPSGFNPSKTFTRSRMEGSRTPKVRVMNLRINFDRLVINPDK